MILIKDVQKCIRTGSAQQRMFGLFCGLILCAASSSGSQAAQISYCEYEFLSKADKGLSGEAKVQISGGILKMLVKSFPYWRSGVLITHSENSYKILLQNKVGIVAAQLRSSIDKEVGPLVGAKILTIRTSDGVMHEGTVDAAGVYDLMKGHCK